MTTKNMHGNRATAKLRDISVGHGSENIYALVLPIWVGTTILAHL